MNEPERRPHGRLVRQAGGHEAFVPAPLPPPIAWDGEIVTALSAADLAIGRLGGEGRRLPNPNLLIRPFVRREAVLSSRIEGTVSGLGDLLAAEAGARVRRNAADLQEVANCVRALEYAVERLGTLPLSLRLVREAHELLMTDVRGNAAAPGQFRRTQNWIGAPGSTPSTATYVPPPADAFGRLPEGLGAVPPRQDPAGAGSRRTRARAVRGHPSVPGRQRPGRAARHHAAAHRAWRPSGSPAVPQRLGEAMRSEYYARLLGTTRAGEWTEWLIYFLRGVAAEAEDATRRIRQVDALMAEWRRLLGGEKSRLPEALLVLFAENPFWTTTRVARRLDVAYTTAARAIDRLQAAGIVAPVGGARRNRLYCAEAMLTVFESDEADIGTG